MTDPTPGTPGTGRGRLAWRALFFVSLACNLLVAGLVVGMFLSHGGGGRFEPPRDPGMPYIRALDEADRRDIHGAMREAFRASRPERPDYAAAYAQALEALRGAPFDAQALAGALEEQHAGAERAQRIGREVLVAHVAAMDAEARQAYAGRLEEALEARRAWHERRREQRREDE